MEGQEQGQAAGAGEFPRYGTPVDSEKITTSPVAFHSIRIEQSITSSRQTDIQSDEHSICGHLRQHSPRPLSSGTCLAAPRCPLGRVATKSSATYLHYFITVLYRDTVVLNGLFEDDPPTVTTNSPPTTTHACFSTDQIEKARSVSCIVTVTASPGLTIGVFSNAFSWAGGSPADEGS